MTAGLPHVEEAAARVVDLLLARPPTLAGGRLLCVDGPAASGKTTLAAAVRRRLRDTLTAPGRARGLSPVQVVHMDDVYVGWDGLAAGMATLAEGVVGPLREGRAGRYRRYDWHRDEPGPERVVPPSPVLLVEGVGAGSTAVGGYGDVVTLLVWVATPSDVRQERWAARDGTAMAAHASAWRSQEREVLRRERTAERADLVVDGRTGRFSSPSPA